MLTCTLYRNGGGSLAGLGPQLRVCKDGLSSSELASALEEDISTVNTALEAARCETIATEVESSHCLACYAMMSCPIIALQEMLSHHCSTQSMHTYTMRARMHVPVGSVHDQALRCLVKLLSLLVSILTSLILPHSMHCTSVLNAQGTAFRLHTRSQGGH